MRRWSGVLDLLGILILIGMGCATPNEKMATITGTVTAPYPFNLPTNSVLEVQLIDRNAVDASHKTLAQRIIHGPQTMPVPFQLTYPPQLLQPGHQYAVNGMLLLAGQPWYVTDRTYHITRKGRIVHADVILRPAQ